ncbi:indolethylamine N-methyltransferase-like [Spea bombifrons]|uniref:indolethylamine N-methyltransferase-like n=1 Tax=Spea bombifrons TaxID=233779 RepID=UPI0023493C36|nr:indolethylamine N-methyltransferase-like [Spea bombifrons]
MDGEFTGKEIYQDLFSPRGYLDTYYDPKKGILVTDGFLDFALRKLHEAFTTRGVKGEVLIDIGHGPTIYQDLSACESFKEIIGADYTDRNREYYEGALRNDPGTFDWTGVIKQVCEMEGKGTTVEEKREKLRNTVKRTVKCDVTKSKPLHPLVLPQVDCVMTLGCLECACKDLDTYRDVLKNISTLLKIGGHLIITEILNCTTYYLGGKWFSCLSLSEEFLRNAITEAGYAIIDLEVIPRPYDKDQYRLCDHDSSFFILARKVRDI